MLLRIFSFPKALLNRWKCIAHHVVNEHQWTDKDGKRHHCDHAPLTAEEQKRRMWLKKDSVAYQDLMSLVFDKRLLKDLQKMALFKHTGKNRHPFYPHVFNISY